MTSSPPDAPPFVWTRSPLLFERETDGKNVQWRVTACDWNGKKLCSKVFRDAALAARELLDLRELVQGLTGKDYYAVLARWMETEEAWRRERGIEPAPKQPVAPEPALARTPVPHPSLSKRLERIEREQLGGKSEPEAAPPKQTIGDAFRRLWTGINENDPEKTPK